MFSFVKNIFSKKQVQFLDDKDKQLLRHNIFYYSQLSSFKKKDFEKEIAYFLHFVPIYFQEVKETRLVELLVATSAVIITFGHSFSYKRHITSVTIVNGTVSNTATGYTTGEVRFQNSFKTMYLSEQALKQGFKNNNDKSNVGIHEFVHILDAADGYVDGVMSVFMPNNLIKIWKDLAEDEMGLIKADQSTIRAYGATNIQEFLTVCSEYFFERPKKLEREHPQVYHLLSSTFKQNPIDTYNFKSKANFNKKKEIGRNDKCPCGSGLKYKKCCLK